MLVQVSSVSSIRIFFSVLFLPHVCLKVKYERKHSVIGHYILLATWSELLEKWKCYFTDSFPPGHFRTWRGMLALSQEGSC